MNNPETQRIIAELKKEIFRQKWLRFTPADGVMPYGMLENILNDLIVLSGGGLKIGHVSSLTDEVIYPKHCPQDRMIDVCITQSLKGNFKGFRIDPVIEVYEDESRCSQQCFVSFINDDETIQRAFEMFDIMHNSLSTALKLYAGLDLKTRSLSQQGEFDWHLLAFPKIDVKIQIKTVPSDILFRYPPARKPQMESTQIIIAEYVSKPSDNELYWLQNT